MKPDDESLHEVPFDPVRDSLKSATEFDWEWIEGVLTGTGDEHARGWLALLKEVRAGLDTVTAPDMASALKKLSRETKVAIATALAADPAVPHKPLPVPGYTTQNDPAIKAVGKNKIAEERILRMIDEYQKSDLAVDQCWLAKAKTSIEEGFMFMNRAIFKPTRVPLPEDMGLKSTSETAGG